MKHSGVCPKCNSQAIIKNVRVPEYGHYNAMHFLSISILGKRKSWFSWDSAKGELRAWVCSECGYTELYTTNPKELFQAYQEWLQEKDKQG